MGFEPEVRSVINYGRTRKTSASPKVWVQEWATRRAIPVGGHIQHFGEQYGTQINVCKLK